MPTKYDSQQETAEKCARKTQSYPGFQNQGSASLTLMESLEDFILNAAGWSPGYQEGNFNPKECAEEISEEGQQNGGSPLWEGTKLSWCSGWISVIM